MTKLAGKQLERIQVKELKKKVSNKKPVIIGHDLAMLEGMRVSHAKQRLVKV